MLKKLLCCSLSLITLMGFGFGTCQKVNASESIVQPRTVMCGCGGYFRPSGTYYTNWSYDNVTRKCTHYARGLDERQSRKKIQEYMCERCKSGYDETTTEYRWVCKGYNS